MEGEDAKMEARILTGSRRQIADAIAHMPGQVHHVVVVLEGGESPAASKGGDNIFEEMTPFLAHAGDADYSRDAIYQRETE